MLQALLGEGIQRMKLLAVQRYLHALNERIDGMWT